MTHRGPFQPLPFCDSVILMDNKLAVSQQYILGAKEVNHVMDWIRSRVASKSREVILCLELARLP